MKKEVKETETYSLEVICINCGRNQYIHKPMGVEFTPMDSSGYMRSSEACDNCGCHTLRRV